MTGFEIIIIACIGVLFISCVIQSMYYGERINELREKTKIDIKSIDNRILLQSKLLCNLRDAWWDKYEEYTELVDYANSIQTQEVYSVEFDKGSMELFIHTKVGSIWTIGNSISYDDLLKRIGKEKLS